MEVDISGTEEIGGQLFGAESENVTRQDDLPKAARGKTYTMPADVTSRGKQKKVARFRHFEIICAEPHWLGGEDQHPQPLTYLAAAVGF